MDFTKLYCQQQDEDVALAFHLRRRSVEATSSDERRCKGANIIHGERKGEKAGKFSGKESTPEQKIAEPGNQKMTFHFSHTQQPDLGRLSNSPSDSTEK